MEVYTEFELFLLEAEQSYKQNPRFAVLTQVRSTSTYGDAITLALFYSSSLVELLSEYRPTYLLLIANLV